jgi:TPR repeat protein
MLKATLRHDREGAAFTVDSLRCLNRDSNFLEMIAPLRNGVESRSLQPAQGAAQWAGEADMGRTEFAAIENGSIGEASEDMFFRLGMMYSTGAEVPTDYVSAHKWFNLAAMRGNAEATRLRREIATQMSEAEIAQAQRAARDWLKH